MPHGLPGELRLLLLTLHAETSSAQKGEGQVNHSMKTQLELARQCLTLAGTPFTEESLTGGWTKLRIQNTPGKCPEENLRRFFPSAASFDSTGNLVAVG